MLSFFMSPYPDEILYSFISRYHLYSGNKSQRQTIQELFSNRCWISLELPRDLEQFSSNIGHDYYNSNYFLMNHTLFPLYYPFITLQRRESLLDAMKYRNTLPDLIAGLTRDKMNIRSNFKYCPICCSEDIDKFGESYFHRLHQVNGVFICPIHMCALEEYQISISDRANNKLISFNFDDVSSTSINIIAHNTYNHLVNISKAVEFVLNNSLHNFNVDIIYEKYLYIFKERGILLCTGRMDRKRLYNDFIEFYGNELLEKLNINLNGQQNFLHYFEFNKKTTRTLQPIKHILLILFLSGDMVTFFADIPKITEERYSFISRLPHKTDVIEQEFFGLGPWKCLNPVADHYNNMVVNQCKTIYYHGKKTYSGLFTCECGFSYYAQMKKGESTILKKTVKTYGHIWDKKLIEYITIQNIANSNKIAKLMGCYNGTIVVQANRLGLSNYLDICNSCEKIVNKEIPKTQAQLVQSHRETITHYIRENPSCKRNDIIKTCVSSYKYLYFNDHIWFEENMPLSTPRAKRNSKGLPTINWNEVDIQLTEQLKDVYIEILNLENPVRVTKTKLTTMIGKSRRIEENLDKLPKTKEYIKSIIESREQYLLRKIDIIYKDLSANGKRVKKQELKSKTGIRKNEALEVYDRFNYLISNEK